MALLDRSLMTGAVTTEQWTELLTSIGIPASNAKTYTSEFVNNDITENDLINLDKTILQETINITSLGHQLKILRLGKKSVENRSNIREADSTSKSENYAYKSPSASAAVTCASIITSIRTIISSIISIKRGDNPG